MSSWTPSSFSHGADEDYRPEYMDALLAEGRRLQGLGLPVIFTLGHLASLCGVPHGLLHEIVRRRRDPYRKFSIKKRSGGRRLITAPEFHLLRVQRWIHQQILVKQKLHPASAAYAARCNPLENAQRHSRARWLVKVDVTNFFESISERQVYHVFHRMGFRPLLAFQLTRLCTRVAAYSPKYQRQRWHNSHDDRYQFLAAKRIGHLPQGAPTSPILANLVCVTLDGELQACAEKFGCTYSRYADDLVFSADKLSRTAGHEVIKEMSAMLGRHGLTRNSQKTHIAPPGARRVVTGLLVDGDAPRLQREFREKIELHLYHAASKGIREHCERRNFRSLLGFKAHLHGLITYAEQIDPKFGARCRSQFDALEWIGLENL